MPAGFLNTIGSPPSYGGDGGVFEVLSTDGKSIFDGSTNAVTVEGYVQVEQNAQLELKGDIDLAGGIIELDQAAYGHHGSQLVISGHVTLTGYGYVALEGSGTGIVGTGYGATLDNESYIYGSRGGYIGDGDGSLTFINSGTVDSEAGHAGPLIINTGHNAVTNTGILEATGLSELDLYGTYHNSGGTIGAYSDGVGPSVVKLFDATIQGGTLQTDFATPGGSMIEIVATHGDDGANMSIFDGSSGHAVTVDGDVRIDAGANLELIGTIHNEGLIDVDCVSNNGADLIISGTVKLDGGGTITLDGVHDAITGNSHAMLDNISDTISGAGTIAVPVDNDGTIAAVGGLLKITGNVTGDGHLQIGNNATLELGGTSTEIVAFEGPNGTLKIDSTGTSSKFCVEGNSSGLPAGDVIDLVNIAFDPSKDSYNSTTDILTISDGHGHTVQIDIVGGIGSGNNFTFASDGHGGTKVYDPPATDSSSGLTLINANGTNPVATLTDGAPQVSIGGPGNDTFVFHPGEGAMTIGNFNPQADTIELDHFANIQHVQDLAAMITTDGHGGALIGLGSHDSIDIPAVTASYLQAHLQSLVHLH